MAQINAHQPEKKPDPSSGYCSLTKTYYSLRPNISLPAENQPLSLADYCFSLLPSTFHSFPFLLDSSSGKTITYSSFISLTKSLAFKIKNSFPGLKNNDVAFVLSPTSLDVPVLYFALLHLGVTVCPANPVATEAELEHMVRLAKPVIGFASSGVSSKLPEFPLGTVLLDSEQFRTMTLYDQTRTEPELEVKVNQSDLAAILFSSGTTGRVKGVELTHRNFIAVVAGFFNRRRKEENPPHPVALFFIPMFHVFGFFMLFRGVALGETLVIMERFDFEKMLSAVESYGVTYMPVSPPLVVALLKSNLTRKYDLSSLRLLGCGGAPLGKEVSKSFSTRFPDIEIIQGYGLTESAGAAASMAEPDEATRLGSVGKLCESVEAKIVDPVTEEALPPNQQGELWFRGPIVMRGYAGDEEATAATLDQDGWLKTGDLCYFDSEGFIYIVDRLKELIKYKAYQVPPAELEHLLQGHPKIADAAVVPYPDEEAGQIPMAFIVRKPESDITAAQVMDFIANQVSPYKKIRRVAFVKAIPKSPAGKILRRELANHAVSGAPSKL